MTRAGRESTHESDHGSGAREASASPSDARASRWRVVVAGAAGRMGTLAVAAIRAAPDLELAGELVRADDPEHLLHHDSVDILLDLTLADASRKIAPLAARRGIAPVVGTSGLTPADIDALRTACETGGTGGLLVPNFSVGAVLQMQAAERLAAFLECSGLHEIHHPDKRDAPSGTARATAARIGQAARRRDPSAPEPPITSERTAGTLARQVVTFDSASERVVLDHEVRDRAAYVPGMLLALRSVTRLSGLQTGLDALLDADLAQATKRLV